jgi:hypothetical protein
MAVAALEGRVAEVEVRYFIKLCVAVYAATLAVSLLFFESRAVFSVALGGGVTLLNLRFLSTFLKIVFSGGISAGYARVAAVVSFFLMFTAFGAGLYFLTAKGMVNFPALLVSLSVVPLAALAFAAIQSFRAMKGVYGRAD